MHYTLEEFASDFGKVTLLFGLVALGYLIGVRETTEVWANVRDRYYTRRTGD